MKSLFVFFFCAAVSFAADFATGQAARLIIGQPTFTAQQSGTSQVLLGGAGGLAYANGTLIVADSNRVSAAPINHRVLIFRNLPPEVRDPGVELSQDRRCPACVGAADVVLGQPNFQENEFKLSQTGMRLPTAVATDGTMLAVADTDNNRVLIWRSIPGTSGAPADIVVGQPDFNSNRTATPPTSKSMRGPQGVWIQNGRLYVADTQNHRVLVWNSIPTSNGKEADLVLGQPDFNTFIEPDLTKTVVEASPTSMLNPVSVTSDGQRLYVSDLGHNRVLIWNSLPVRNQQPADVAVGQPDLTSAIANNSTRVCEATGEKNENGEDLFPRLCGATLDYPRYALSDGRRLFIADGGNDRVLIFNHVPVSSGAKADIVLGQPLMTINQNSDNANPLFRSSADSIRTPMALAWDGKNLFVSDPFNRRVLVFSEGDQPLPYAGWRNAASFVVYALGSVSFGGTLREGDEITIKIKDREYKYKVIHDDSFQRVIETLVAEINAGDGDPHVLATPNPVLNAIVLTSREYGQGGNSVEYSATTTPSDAQIVATTGGATLDGGQDAAKIAPGSLVSIIADDLQLSDETAVANWEAEELPTELGGVQVYFDGIRAPLLYVSPTQINAQVPWHVLDTTSVNAYVRTERRDGSVSVTTPVAIPIIPQNPGIFAFGGEDPRPGVVLHYSSHATGTVLVDGTARVGDVATVKIEDRSYSYTVKDGDTLAHIRDGLIQAINANPDEKVVAFPAGVFTRIRLQAKVGGPEGNGIAYSATAGDDGQVILTPTGSGLCCANEAGSLVTEQNPALPGETIVIYATGLGLVKPDDARLALRTGGKYWGPEYNEPAEFVSSLAGAKTANVLYAGIKPGTFDVYEVHLELNPDLPTNPRTQLTIAQDIYVSNIITFPLFNPSPPDSQ